MNSDYVIIITRDYQKLIELKGEDADIQYHWGKFYDGVYASQTVK